MEQSKGEWANACSPFWYIKGTKTIRFSICHSQILFAIGGFKFEVQLSYVARSDSR
jgi:hypothetical protein